jgi:hypothetical protein
MIEGTAYNALRDEAMLRLREEVRPFHSPVHDVAASASLLQGEDWADCVHYSERIGDVIIRQILSTDGV